MRAWGSRAALLGCCRCSAKLDKGFLLWFEVLSQHGCVSPVISEPFKTSMGSCRAGCGLAWAAFPGAAVPLGIEAQEEQCQVLYGRFGAELRERVQGLQP